MAGRLDFGGGVGVAELSNLVQNLRKCALLSIVKAFMNLAVALRPRSICSFSRLKVCDPVKDRLRTTEYHID